MATIWALAASCRISKGRRIWKVADSSSSFRFAFNDSQSSFYMKIQGWVRWNERPYKNDAWWWVWWLVQHIFAPIPSWQHVWQTHVWHDPFKRRFTFMGRLAHDPFPVWPLSFARLSNGLDLLWDKSTLSSACHQERICYCWLFLHLQFNFGWASETHLQKFWMHHLFWAAQKQKIKSLPNVIGANELSKIKRQWQSIQLHISNYFTFWNMTTSQGEWFEWLLLGHWTLLAHICINEQMSGARRVWHEFGGKSLFDDTGSVTSHLFNWAKRVTAPFNSLLWLPTTNCFSTF